MRVIYLDVLFLINFIIDYLLLGLTGDLRGNYSSPFRLLFAAAFGGAMSVILFFAPEINLLMLAAKPICCALMVFAAYGFEGRRRFLGDCAMLCALSFAFSGGIFALSELFPGGGGMVNNTAVYFNISIRLLVAGVAAAYFVMSIFNRPGSYRHEKKTRSVKCGIRGADAHFNAFEDTGNMMCDPVSRKKVIMVSPSIIRTSLDGAEQQLISGLSRENIAQTFEKLAAQYPSVYGIAPFTSVGGNGLMITIKPEKLEIDGMDTDEYILGLSMDEIETVCGCRALIGC
ncbi:MAG: sigma-E processing peptidase SpoIIGA [Clostridiaceae bacterium]|nr:sigma-E processing peptidase SpoIIGA [Clostridiaceae bacterium]